MRKSLIANGTEAIQDPQRWFDISNLATAELSSEDPAFPFENALSQVAGGWHALDPGPQMIRLRFDQPLKVRHIRVEFKEPTIERSQEFAIFAQAQDGSRREVVRQQWNFTPNESAAEIEEYHVELNDLICLELKIDPGRHDLTRVATLDFIGLN